MTNRSTARGRAAGVLLASCVCVASPVATASAVPSTCPSACPPALAAKAGIAPRTPSTTITLGRPAPVGPSPTDDSSEPALLAASPILLVTLLGMDIDLPLPMAVAATRTRRERSLFRSVLGRTLSAALPGSRTELAVPFAAIDYRSREGHDNGYRYGHDGDYSLRRIDLQLRRFAKDQREGLYAGTLLRASWMDGIAHDPLSDGGDGRSADGKEDRDDALSRIGAGVVVGLRGHLRAKALPGQLYWGANLQLGRWLGGSPTTLAAELDPLRETGRYFVDIELANIGMRF